MELIYKIFGKKLIDLELLSKENIKKGVKIAKVGATLISTIIAINWATFAFYLEDYVEEKIEIHDSEIKERNKDKKPLRDLLGEALKVPSEVVPYYIAVKFAEFDSLSGDIESFSDVYIDYIDLQMTRNYLGVYMDLDGQEWWSARDGRDYRIAGYDGVGGWLIYHGTKRYIYR